MLRYILYAVCVFLALEGLVCVLLRLAERISGSVPRGCAFVCAVSSADTAEQELYRAWRFYNACLAGRGVRFEVLCRAGGEAQEICRRFCADRGLYYCPKMVYNGENHILGE